MTADEFRELGGLVGYAQSLSMKLSHQLTGVRISKTARTCNSHASHWDIYQEYPTSSAKR